MKPIWIVMLASFALAVPAISQASALVAATHLIPFSALGLLLFNAIYGGAIGALMTPWVVWLALADGSA